MWRFQDFNNGRHERSYLDNVAEVMGVKGRTNTKHNAVEDVRITFGVAALFYMMDNRLRISDGKSKTPLRPPKRKYNFG